jgi:hypothetical protein
LNTTTKIIIGLFCLAIVVIIGLAIVVGCLQKKLQRYIKLFNLISLESMINFFHACPHHTILASSCEKSIIIPYCLLYLFNIVIYQLFFISSTCKYILSMLPSTSLRCLPLHIFRSFRSPCLPRLPLKHLIYVSVPSSYFLPISLSPLYWDAYSEFFTDISLSFRSQTGIQIF